jgi:hypothetical protein
LDLGATAGYGGLEITAVSAEKGPKTHDGTPSFAVAVRYNNGTDGTVDFDEFDWSVQDSSGTRSQMKARFDMNLETLGSGKLAPGETKEGTVYFAGGTDVRKIAYAPSMHASEQDLTSWVVE